MHATAYLYIDSLQVWKNIRGTLEYKLRLAQIVIAILSAVILIGGLSTIYATTRNHIIPFIVTLHGNELVKVNKLQPNAFRAFQPQLAIALSKDFITQVRSRTLDNVQDNENHINAFAVASESASSLLKRHFESQEIEDSQIKVQINDAILKKNNVIEVHWQETKFNNFSDTPQSAQSYSAEITFEFSKVSLDRGVAHYNPLGFYITHCTWYEN